MKRRGWQKSRSDPACGLEAKRGECEIETPETETINGVHGKYREVDEAR